MVAVPIEMTDIHIDTQLGEQTPWVVLVIDDPNNLIPYVAHVFQKVFGWNEEKAMKHTMEVHELGKSVVFSGTQQEAKDKAEIVGSYGLWTKVTKQ